MNNGFEDKWVEFVAAEIAQKRGEALRAIVVAEEGLRMTMRQVEVRGSYFLLLAGAILCWIAR